MKVHSLCQEHSLPTCRHPCLRVELLRPAAKVSWVIFCSGRLLGCLQIQYGHKQLGMERTTTSSLVLFQPFQRGRNKLRHVLTIRGIPFLTKIVDVSRFMSRFVILSNSKKCNISFPPIFAGGANSRRWGRAGPSRRRLAQPAPGPADDTFKTTGPSPTKSVRFQSHATSARPRQRVSNLTGRLPGLAREIFKIFLLFLSAVSPPRGFEAATCSLARPSRFLWGRARSLQSAYEGNFAMPLYPPSHTVGAAWVT